MWACDVVVAPRLIAMVTMVVAVAAVAADLVGAVRVWTRNKGYAYLYCTHTYYFSMLYAFVLVCFSLI